MNLRMRLEESWGLLDMKYKTYRLGDVVNIFDKKRVPLSSMQRAERQGKYRYFGAQGVIDYVDDYIFEGIYLLIAEDGENLKSKKQNVAQIVSGKFWVNNHAHILQAKEEHNIYYLGYLINSIDLSGYITGSAQPKLSQTNLNAIALELPDKRTQDKIASVLQAFDNKIDLNNEINNNLEQQAQALFKSWFVGFEPFDESFIDSPIETKIPHSLQMVQIGSLPHILETGKRPKGGAVATGVPSIGAENVKRLGEVNFASAKYIPVEFAQKMDKGKVHGYELMLYKDGGKPGTFIPHFSMFGEGFPYDDFFINEHVFKLDFGDKGFNEFCYFYLQTDYPYNWLANNGGKAAVPGINQQDVNSIWIYHPDNPLVKEYCKWVQPIFTTILKNCSQNVKLSQLRDAILPKLMSGELDVSNIEI